METRLNFSGDLREPCVRVRTRHPHYDNTFIAVPLTAISPIPGWSVGGWYEAEATDVVYDAQKDMTSIHLTIAGSRRET